MKPDRYPLEQVGMGPECRLLLAVEPSPSVGEGDSSRPERFLRLTKGCLTKDFLDDGRFLDALRCDRANPKFYLYRHIHIRIATLSKDKMRAFVMWALRGGMFKKNHQ